MIISRNVLVPSVIGRAKQILVPLDGLAHSLRAIVHTNRKLQNNTSATKFDLLHFLPFLFFPTHCFWLREARPKSQPHWKVESIPSTSHCSPLKKYDVNTDDTCDVKTSSSEDQRKAPLYVVDLPQILTKNIRESRGWGLF